MDMAATDIRQASQPFAGSLLTAKSAMPFMNSSLATIHIAVLVFVKKIQ